MCARDCQQFLVTGKYIFGKSCIFYHLKATKNQVSIIKEKLKQFIDEPLGITGKNKKINAEQ